MHCMPSAHNHLKHSKKRENSLLSPNPALKLRSRKANGEVVTRIVFYLSVWAALKFRARRLN